MNVSEEQETDAQKQERRKKIKPESNSCEFHTVMSNNNGNANRESAQRGVSDLKEKKKKKSKQVEWGSSR